MFNEGYAIGITPAKSLKIPLNFTTGNLHEKPKEAEKKGKREMKNKKRKQRKCYIHINF